jgi:hypothetical protein
MYAFQLPRHRLAYDTILSFSGTKLSSPRILRIERTTHGAGGARRWRQWKGAGRSPEVGEEEEGMISATAKVIYKPATKRIKGDLGERRKGRNSV